MKVVSHVRAMVSSEGAVLRHMRRGGTFSLNPVGAKIWELVQKGLPTDQIVVRISEQFSVPHEQVEKDVADFLRSLEAHQLIQPN